MRSAFLFLAAVAGVGWALLFLRSDLFLIKDAEGIGLTTIDQTDLTKLVFRIIDDGKWRPWDSRHRWFLDVKKMEQELQHRLFAESVTVDGVKNNILRLKIKERPNRVVLVTQEGAYWLRLTGAIERELSVEERKDVSLRLNGRRISTSDDPPIIIASLEKPHQSSSTQMFVSTQSVRSWIHLSGGMRNADIAFRALEPKPSVTSTFIEVILPEVPKRLLIDINDPTTISGQIKAYQVLKQSKDVARGEYRLIDLRIPNRIYLRE